MEYYRKIGLRKLPQVFVNGFPLGESELEGDSFEESVINKVMSLTQEIQMAVYKGEVHDSTNLLDWLMNRDEIMPRLNPRILTQERQYLAMNEFDDAAQAFIKNLKYVKKDFEEIFINIV